MSRFTKIVILPLALLALALGALAGFDTLDARPAAAQIATSVTVVPSGVVCGPGLLRLGGSLSDRTVMATGRAPSAKSGRAPSLKVAVTVTTR